MVRIPNDETFDVSDPGSTLANLPGLLGHYCDGSLVVVFSTIVEQVDLGPATGAEVRPDGTIKHVRLISEELGPVFSRDLSGELSGGAAEAREARAFLAASTTTMAAEMAENGWDTADVYAIDERLAEDLVGGGDLAERLAGMTHAFDEEVGVKLRHFVCAPRIKYGATIIQLDPAAGDFGRIIATMPDPEIAPATASARDHGAYIHRNARAIQMQFEPVTYRGSTPLGKIQLAAIDKMRRIDEIARDPGNRAESARDLLEAHGRFVTLAENIASDDVSINEAMEDPGHLETGMMTGLHPILRDLAGIQLLNVDPAIRKAACDLVLGWSKIFTGIARSNLLYDLAMAKLNHRAYTEAHLALEAALESNPDDPTTPLLINAVLDPDHRDDIAGIFASAAKQVLVDILDAMGRDAEGNVKPGSDPIDEDDDA